MTTKLVKVDKSENDRIWILTLDNPPANILTPQVLDELETNVDKFNADPNACVLILTGAGERTFSAGADINEISKIQSAERGIFLARRGQDLCNKIENSTKPIIAAINALCLGGGNEIVMACHIRIASERAKFGQPEINIGIIPGWGGTQRLPRLIGVSRARKLILTGDILTAQDAMVYGLVDEVVEQGKVVDQAMDLAKKIIRNSQIGIRLSQEAIRDGCKKSLSDGLGVELERFGKVCASEDMKEGIKAYKEKRQPQYKNK